MRLKLSNFVLLLPILLLYKVLVVSAKDFLDYVDPNKIKENLRLYTSEPHVAGTDANHRVADKIAAKFREAGLEDVKFTEYEVLLSYPNYLQPNTITIYNSKKERVFKSSGTSPVVFPGEQGKLGAGIQWLAYSANGKVVGDPVFLNYGRPEDYEYLKSQNVDVKGKIAIIRYGKLFRGNKVKFAQLAGAIGVVIYSDPADCAEAGTEKENVYPFTDYMPPGGAQRGVCKVGDGDLLTPLYPSKPDLYSSVTIEQLKEAHTLPDIPILPLGYRDAKQIFSRFGGKDAPASWQGGLKTQYKLGPGFEKGEKLELDVKASLEKRKIKNVIGFIRGKSDPDRYILLSNHYDAWVYGSVDPNSGTSILSEVARSLVQSAKEGKWKPERTVVFCNWDAEESGLIGSTEFVEEYAKMLSERAVVILNIDLISGNATLNVDSVPTVYETVVNAAKKVPNPNKEEVKKGRKTVYDSWFHYKPGNFPNYPDFPELETPGGGSDHETFLSYLGIPAVDVTYERLNKNGKVAGGYPLYHTLYETPFLNEHLFDNDNFATHAATAKYWMQLTREFAEPVILPINVSLFADTLLNSYFMDLKNDLVKLTAKYPKLLTQQNNLLKNGQEFVDAATKYQKFVNGVKDTYPRFDLRTRGINDRLMAVERCFIGPKGIPGSPAKRNVLFAVSAANSYAGKKMPGVYDQIDALNKATTPTEQNAILGILLEQISAVQYGLQCATKTVGQWF